MSILLAECRAGVRASDPTTAAEFSLVVFGEAPYIQGR